MKRRPTYYVLRGHEPVPTDNPMAWARMFESPQRVVGQDHVGELLVSTVFLGIDHNWGSGPPLLFESAIFGAAAYVWNGKLREGLSDIVMRRSATWEEAEADHAELLAAARRLLLEIGLDIADALTPITSGAVT